MTVIAHCHCGAVRFELPAMPAEGTVCNCSFCNRTGAVWAYHDQKDVPITDDAATMYSASDGANEHYFCARCGGNTHALAPDYSAAFEPDGSPKEGVEVDMSREAKRLQVNLRMIDDFDPDAIRIEEVDGRHNW